MDLLTTFIKNQLQGAEKSESISKSEITYISKDRLFVFGISKAGGLITEKKKEKLLIRFENSARKLFFISLFDSRKEFDQYFDDIAWGSYAWFGNEPEHTIHFEKNGTVKPIR